MKKTLVTLVVLATLNANAHGDHKHDHSNHVGAHEHGVANLNLVVEGDELKIMLESPAMNVWGFEYEPKSEEDLKKSHDALHYLKDGDWAAIKGGECKIHEGDVDWKYAEQVHEHFHGEHKHEHSEHKHEHGEHKHEHGEHKHEHGEHKHEHGEHKHEHGEHKHEHGEHKHEHGEHSDVDVKLDFDCAAPTAISSVAIELFEQYAGFEKINVQWIAGDKQGATTLTKDSHEIHFK